MQDTFDKKTASTPLAAGGLAVHSNIGTPLAATKAAALLIQGADSTTYLIELLNEAQTTGLRLVRRRADGRRDALLNIPRLPSRWVGSVSLDVVWWGTVLRIYVNGTPVANPVEVGLAPKARVLLFARGPAVFDELAAVSLRPR